MIDLGGNASEKGSSLVIRERHIRDATINTGPRPFLVRIFENKSGYGYKCMVCGGKATVRAELYNHLQEPQGSEFYCENDRPPNIGSTSE